MELLWGGSSETDNSITFVASPVYYGNYSVKYLFGGTAGSNSNYKPKEFGSNYNTYNIRLYFYLESESLSDGSETSVFEVTHYTDTEVSARLTVYKSGTSLYLKAYYYDDTNGLTAFSNLAPIETGEWYEIEFYQKADGTGLGEARFYVNGAMIDQATNLTNSGGYMRKFFLGQKNGANDEAITYYIDEVAVDSQYRNYIRPTDSLDTTKPYHYDYQVKDLTVNSGGILKSEQINSPARQYLWAYGDVSIFGLLSLNYPIGLRIKSETQTQHGIIVNSGGKFVTNGYLRPDPRLLISAVGQDNLHNPYILCNDGSTCRFVRTEFSYLGSDTTDKYGITAKSLDPESASEGIALQYSNLHHMYQPVRLESVSNAFIYGNIIHDSTYGIYLTSSNNNLISHNDIYTINNQGIILDSSDSNTLYANLLYDVPTAITLNGASSYNRIYNQTISSSTGIGINLSGSSQSSNQIKNSILCSCATAISDSGTSTTIDHNLFYNNTSDGSIGTNATTGVDPLFISTSPSDTTFFYLSKNSPALGAGIDLFDGLSPGTVNYGARLGFVKNVTDNNLFNYINAASNDTDTSDGDTITTYANNILQATFSDDGVQLSQDLVKIAVPEEVVTADGDLVGDYIFIEAGQDFGYYYPIVASKEDTTDTITIYSPDHSASTFHTGDKFTVVDRVYGWKRNVCPWPAGSYDGVFYLKAISGLTFRTYGMCIVDQISNRYGFYVGDHVQATDIQVQGFTVLNFSAGIHAGQWNAPGDGVSIMDCIFTKDNVAISAGNFDQNGDGVRGDYGAYIKNNHFIDCEQGIYLSAYGDSIKIISNLFKNNTKAIKSQYDNEFSVVCSNWFLDNELGWNSGYHDGSISAKANIFLGNGKSIVWGAIDEVYLYNNTFVANTYGISCGGNYTSSNQVKNNIFAYNDNGIGKGEGGGYSLIEDFNYYYQNGTNYYSTLGSNSILGTSDPFKYTDLGTADAASTTTMIYIPGADWAENQWQGWGVKIESGGSVYWAGVYSNTKDRLYLAPSLDIEPDNLTVYITDFSLVPNAQPLGQGCLADGTTEPGTVNMGASLGFVKNETDGTLFNTIQDAADDGGLSAGDVITTYAVNESSGTVGAVEDMGPFARITLYNSTSPTSEDTITSDDQYDGMYVYFTSGADKGKYYLIADCAEMSTSDGDSTDDDLIVIVCDDPSNIHTGDTFVIVDRIYDRIDGTLGSDSANAVLSVDGTAESPITWQASGRVVIDGKDSATYGLAINGADYQVIDGLDIQNTASYGVYATGPATGLYIKDNLIHHTGKGIGASLTNSIIENNQLWQITADPINLDSASTNTVLSHNKIWTAGQQATISANQSTEILNQFLNTGLTLQGSQSVAIKNLIYGKPLTLAGTGSENRIWNNTVYRSGGDGIYIVASQTKNKLRNNMLIANTEAGIDDDNPSATDPNDIDFNLYLSNSATYEGTGTRGGNEKELTALTLQTRESGTVGANSTNAMIVDTGKNWVGDMFAGMILKLTDGSSNTYYAPILSNTQDRIYLASALGYSPAGDGSETYEVIDLSVAGTNASDANTSLGTGCASDGATAPGTINIGWITDFVKNTTDSLKFNSMQDAHDDSSLSAGDTVTTYAHNEYENATIGATVTDLGPFVKLEVAEEGVVSSDDQYNGMYIFVEAGENYGRHYLIVDTDERTSADDGTDVDTITILADDADTFHEGDKFTIVDRVYERWGECDSNNCFISRFSKPGSASQYISWQGNDKVILTGKDCDIGLSLYENSDFVSISDFVFYSFDTCAFKVYSTEIYDSHVSYADRLIRNLFIGNEDAVYLIGNAGATYIGNHLVIKNTFIDNNVGVLIGDSTSPRVLVGDNLFFSHAGFSIKTDSGSYNNLMCNNRIFGNEVSTGIGLAIGWPNARREEMLNNIIVTCYRGVDIDTYQGTQELSHNIIIGNKDVGVRAYNPNSSGLLSLNNNLIVSSPIGVSIQSGTPISSDFNFYYNNNTDVSGFTKGANSISGYDPNFRVLESGTVSAGTNTTMIKDTTKSWTPNQWQGYGIKVDVGGTTYWAGIYSNTADTLYITPKLGATPTAGTDTYEITDFSISPTTSDNTPLGQGCLADGTTEPGDVNMGAYLEFVKLDDGTKYNSLKQALDSSADGYYALIGSHVYVKSGSIKAVTNSGTITQIDVDDSLVPDNDYYDGMYLVVTRGNNTHKAYLIVDTVENDPDSDNVDDSIYIFTDFTDGFSAGDVFDIVDRIYNYGAVDKAVELKAKGLSSQQTLLSADGGQYWYAGSLDFEDPIDYALYDSVTGGCECTELMNFYPVNYTTLTGGTNNPARVGDYYFYPCSACYMDLLMRARNYFVEEGVLIKCGINEDYPNN